jgi:hypothetical protein
VVWAGDAAAAATTAEAAAQNGRAMNHLGGNERSGDEDGQIVGGTRLGTVWCDHAAGGSNSSGVDRSITAIDITIIRFPPTVGVAIVVVAVVNGRGGTEYDRTYSQKKHILQHRQRSRLHIGSIHSINRCYHCHRPVFRVASTAAAGRRCNGRQY